MSSESMLMKMSRKHLVEHQVPKDLYNELYQRLDEAQFLFIPLIIKDNKPKVYFEKNDPTQPIICRLFWRHDDMKMYVKHLNALGLVEGEVVGWESTPESIINSIIAAWSKLPGQNVNVMASAFFDNEFRDVEIFWTSNHNSMI